MLRADRPALLSLEILLGESDTAFVVAATERIPGKAANRAMSASAPRRTNGSPPVSRILRMPAP